MIVRTSEQLKKLNGLMVLWLIKQGVPPQEVHEVFDPFDGSGHGERSGGEEWYFDRQRITSIHERTLRLEDRIEELERKPPAKPESGGAVPLGWLFFGVVIGIIIAGVVFKGM